MSVPSDIAFTPAVKAQQAARGSRDLYEGALARRPWPEAVPADLAAFVAAQASVFLGTASAGGQPYIQHRGGPPGFLKVLEPRLLGFADLEGNRQYVTLGNLSENPRAFLFLIDYAGRRRIKIWGSARVVEDDPALMARLGQDGGTRAILFEIGTWDANCPKHIPQRFEAADVARALAARDARIAELEAELAGLAGG
ncbi:pyridoxamine 5'-phosphate oxidase family protein [Poseidonocella sp. HB161398]|uniref:pyridoxamine 5'-phosphate oxidase family protein n=1 Tax=Poseidonocella sp. HB161398 TaxID=2320855 RepID=UPI001107CFD2|nr:pyridoxamine 5'-phosphate oxidase family protein [Poseidonocella sp. HB161398]